jgi:hypothetical protein
MAKGDPGKESFRNAVIEFRNQFIIAGMAPLMLMREELTGNDDFQDRSGMDDSTKHHFLQHLVNCDRIRRRITYNPSGIDLGDAIAKAIDPNAVIEGTEVPVGGDEIQGQSGSLLILPWDLSGANPNIPLPNTLDMSSNNGILLLGAIDSSIVAWTRLESRHRTRFVTATDSMRIYGLYQQIFTFLTEFGGDANRVDVANMRAVDEPLGPENAPNRLTEKATKPTG